MKMGILLLIAGLAIGASHPDQVQETKAKVQKDLEEGFASLKLQVQELQEKMKHTSGEVQKDMQTQMASLEKDQKELQKKINKLKTSSGQAWDDVKAGASSAFENFNQSVQKAKKRFQEEKK